MSPTEKAEFADLPDLATATQFRPAEIKTYHTKTYDRIAPEKTTFDTKGKTVLVTAGATGIGFQVATSFAKAGVAHIVLIQRRPEVLEKAKKTLASDFPNVKVTTYAASITDYARVSEILKEVGQIDVLVPSAAGIHNIVPTAQVTLEEVQNVFAVNVIATFHIIKEYLALPSKAHKTVLYVSSGASQLPMPGNSSYGASKAAANQLVTQFAQDLALAGKAEEATVISWHPGAVWTELAQEYLSEKALPWEDPRLPGDFAVWLASPEAKFLAGKFVWAQWDVDDILSLEERVKAEPGFLTIGLER